MVLRYLKSLFYSVSPYPIYLKGFGDSSIDILIRAQVDTPILADFMKVRNDLNLSLMDVMEANHCSFAFPSTSIYVEQTAPPAQV